MNQKRITFIIVAIGVLLVTGSFFLMTATPAAAQCGSQASSCKNCHETQAQDPVNNDGTTWHTQHAFGDFCYLCHAGNNQATDKVAAHTGMVAPLADINASCKSCHPDDTLAKAQVYATTLGVGRHRRQRLPGSHPTCGSATIAPGMPQQLLHPQLLSPRPTWWITPRDMMPWRLGKPRPMSGISS